MNLGASLERYRSALRYADLRRMLAAFTILELGGWSYTIVIAAWLYKETGSASSIATLAAIRWITGLAVNPYAGVIADRYDRRTVLAICAGGTTVLLAIMAAIVATGAPVWMVFVVAALMAVFQSPSRPASSALIPEIVEEQDLVTANVLINVLENLVIVLGPLLGGLLILTGNDVLAVAINALADGLAAILYWSLRIRSRGEVEEGTGVFRQWKSGLGELAQRPSAIALAACTVLSAALYAPELVFFAELTTHLDLNQSGYSSFFAASALGGVLVVLIADRMASSSRLALLVVGCLFLQGAPYILISQADQYWVVLGLLVISGAGLVMVDVIALTALQRTMPNGVMGRTMATVTAAALLTATLTITGAGYAVEEFGISSTLLFVGITFPGLSLLMLPLLLRGEAATAAQTATIRDLADFIERLDLFDGLSRSGIETLAHGAERISFPAGHILIRQGDAPDYLWLLEDGDLGITIANQETALPTVSAPGWVGEIGLLRNQPRSATVTSMTPVAVLRIPGDRFLEAIEASSASRSLISLTTERVDRVRIGTNPEVAMNPALEAAG